MCVGCAQVTLRAAEQPGSREAERAPGTRERVGADPMNLIRVMPAEGEMKKPITTDQRHLWRATNMPSHRRLLSRTWPEEAESGA